MKTPPPPPGPLNKRDRCAVTQILIGHACLNNHLSKTNCSVHNPSTCSVTQRMTLSPMCWHNVQCFGNSGTHYTTINLLRTDKIAKGSLTTWKEQTVCSSETLQPWIITSRAIQKQYPTVKWTWPEIGPLCQALGFMPGKLLTTPCEQIPCGSERPRDLFPSAGLSLVHPHHGEE